MSFCCFMCQTYDTQLIRRAINLFGYNGTFLSGKKLHEVVSEIVEKPLSQDSVHSKILCCKCFQSCRDYDRTATTVRTMKSALLNKFKQSLNSSNLNYDTYEEDVKSKILMKTEKKVGKIVLPASKLQPLTPDLLQKVGKLAAANKSNFMFGQNKTPTSQPISISSVVSQADKQTDLLTTLANSVNGNTNSIDVKSFNLSTLSEGFMKSDNSFKHDVDDDDSMEIDEDCALSVVPMTSANGDLMLEVQGVKRQISQNTDNSDFIDVNVLQSLDNVDGSDTNKFILGKLRILHDADDDGDADDDCDGDDEHTIVLDSEHGSILHMVSGQRFMLDGNELSIVMPQNDDNDHEQADSQDSNDEPQIELQVSGDEETANAIIAAAQEQGGAFIKVESGEMFQVKSVQSKTHREDKSDTLNMVEKVDGKYKCLICDHQKKSDAADSVGDAEWMMRHLRKSHDARIYICSHCGETYHRRAEYTSHMAIHTKKPLVKLTRQELFGDYRANLCRKCGKHFASKYTLNAHKKTHSDRPRPFKCNQCTKSFLTQQNLTQHVKTHSGIKEFICNICNKAFSTQHNLEVHGVVHSKARPFVCGTCSKGFARRAELRDHLRTHTGERPFSCDTCGATFSQRSNLHSHRRATHLNERRHKCSLCPKKFKRKRLLDYHVQATHTGERPFKCELCTSTFVYPEHYKKHMMTHTGERPYECEICGKTFTTRDNRNTHRFVHSDKKPYECLACGAGFMRKNFLYDHMNSSGHLAESIVVNQPRVTKVSTTVYETTSDALQVDTSDVKPIISKVSSMADNSDPLFLQDLAGERMEATVLEAVDVTQLENAQIVDENGEMLRIIQVKLPSGDDGWVAVNH